MWIYSVLVAAALLSQSIKVMPRPEVPFLDWNACPFEGCTYREWKANKSVPLYDTWQKKRKRIGTVSPGEKVVAVTGVVITYKPGLIRMERDYSLSEFAIGSPKPDQDLKRGDTLLTYAYRGEGNSAVWLNGKYYSDFDISFVGCRGANCVATYVDMGVKEWWAQVRLKSGRTAWVFMDGNPFDDVDRFG